MPLENIDYVRHDAIVVKSVQILLVLYKSVYDRGFALSEADSGRASGFLCDIGAHFPPDVLVAVYPLAALPPSLGRVFDHTDDVAIDKGGPVTRNYAVDTHEIRERCHVESLAFARHKMKARWWSSMASEKSATTFHVDSNSGIDSLSPQVLTRIRACPVPFLQIVCKFLHIDRHWRWRSWLRRQVFIICDHTVWTEQTCNVIWGLTGYLVARSGMRIMIRQERVRIATRL